MSGKNLRFNEPIVLMPCLKPGYIVVMKCFSKLHSIIGIYYNFIMLDIFELSIYELLYK